MSTLTNTTSPIGQTGVFTGKNFSGSFIPVIWSALILKAFYEEALLPSIVNTDYEGEVKAQGDTVKILKEPKVTTRPYTIGQTLTTEVPDPEDTTLVIDRATYFQEGLNDIVSVQSSPNLRSLYAIASARAMKDALDYDVITGTATRPGFVTQADPANQGAAAGVNTGAYNLGTAAAPVTLTPANIIGLLVALASALDEQCVPESDRFLLVDPATRLQLLQSPLSQAMMMGDPKSPVRTGKLGVIDRFTVYVTNKLPQAAAGQDYWGNAAAGTAKRRLIVAGQRSAVSFVPQVSKVEQLRNPNDFGDIMRGLAVYGYKTVRPEALATAFVN